MSQGEDMQPDREPPDSRTRRRNIITSVAVFVGAMLFVAGAFHLARGERQFALGQWQTRLRASITDPMIKTVAWDDAGNQALAEVAANATVQIYLSELEAAGYNRQGVPQGETQAAFVASYVLSAASRGPFAPLQRQGAPGGPPPVSKAGLALFDGHGQMIASSPGYKPSAELVTRLTAAGAQRMEAPLISIVGETPVVTFFRPIKPLQSLGAAAPIGYVIGSRTVDASLMAALRSPLGADQGRLSLFASAEGGIRYLAASRAAETASPGQELAWTSTAGEVAAVRGPDRLVQAPDIDGHASLLYGARVADSPFVLVASVPADVALAGVEQRERTLLGALLLAILAMIAAGIAFSRHQAGQAASQLAAAARREAAHAAKREAFLRTVVNAYPGALLLVRRDGTVGFANARFAGKVGTDAAALQGRPLQSVLPAPWHAAIAPIFGREAGLGAARTEFDDAARRYAASIIPLADGEAPQEAGALLLVDDITELAAARERRVRIYRGVVDILLEAIDRRDPAAAAHSRRAGKLAREIAVALGADEGEIETAELAGSLQSARKLFVPAAVLRKSEGLDDDERAQINEAAQRWLSLLGQISIDFPVADVSKLAHDLMHGLQPQGRADAVLRAAYVVAAADAYVALTSPRAYRPAHASDAAIDALKQTIPSLPPEVVEALRQSVAVEASES